MNKKQNGFSLVEIMIGIVIITIAAVGVFIMMGKSASRAEVYDQQKHVQDVHEFISSTFTSESSYTNVRLNTLPTKLQSSPIGASFNVAPGNVNHIGDSYDIQLAGVSKKVCLELPNAVGFSTDAILINGVSVQPKSLSLPDPEQLVEACNMGLGGNTSALRLRFMHPQRQALPAPTPNTSCFAPQQTRTATCPPNQTGEVIEVRTGNCDFSGNVTYTDWVVRSSTCTPIVPPIVRPAVVSPDGLCTSSTEQRLQNCPTGQLGAIIEQRQHTCNGTEQVAGSWEVVGNFCHTQTTNPTCETRVQRFDESCTLHGWPANTQGHIITEQAYLCPEARWTDRFIIENTCTGSHTWSCSPRIEEGPHQFTTPCAAGTQGGPLVTNQQRRRISTCPTATGALVWPSTWQILSSNTTGTCTTCPATVTEERWVDDSRACPEAYSGSHTWQYQESRVRSYNCPSGTTSLPAPSFSAWTRTGRMRNESNTCGPSATCTPPANQVINENWTDARNANCPSSVFDGFLVQHRPHIRSRTRTASCPDPYGAPVWNEGTWTGWNPQSDWVTVDNRCSVPGCGTFENNARNYMARNADLLAAFGPTGYNAAFAHWNSNGFHEGRQSCWGAPDATCSPSTQTESNVWQETRNAGCPANHTGAHMQRRDITDNRTRTSTCPNPHGAPVWGGWGNWYRVAEGGWVTTSNTCTPSSPPGGGVCPAPVVVVSTSSMDMCGMGMPNVWGGNVTVTTTTTTTYDCSSGTAVGTTSSVRSNPPIGGCLCEVPPRNAIPLYPSGWRVPASGGRPEMNYVCR